MSLNVIGFIEWKSAHSSMIFSYHSAAETAEDLVNKLIEHVSNENISANQISYIKIFEGNKNEHN